MPIFAPVLTWGCAAIWSAMALKAEASCWLMTCPRASLTALHAKGAAPILVIGTTGDPATPYEWAEALADQLDSGQLLTWEGNGHAAYTNSGHGPCVTQAVDTYLLTGTMPKKGLTCHGKQ